MVRQTASQEPGELKSDASVAQAVFLEALDNGDPVVRFAAIEGLQLRAATRALPGSGGPERCWAAVPLLIKILQQSKTRDVDARTSVRRSLGRDRSAIRCCGSRSQGSDERQRHRSPAGCQRSPDENQAGVFDFFCLRGRGLAGALQNFCERQAVVSRLLCMPAFAALGADLRFTGRLFRKNLGISLIAITSIALGIGASSAIFSLVYAVPARPVSV